LSWKTNKRGCEEISIQIMCLHKKLEDKQLEIMVKTCFPVAFV